MSEERLELSDSEETTFTVSPATNYGLLALIMREVGFGPTCDLCGLQPHPFDHSGTLPYL